jgi:hypothetical protein
MGHPQYVLKLVERTKKKFANNESQLRKSKQASIAVLFMGGKDVV